MTLLILGLALWWAAHLFKRVAPEARARMGDAGKGIAAVAILASVVLMYFGYGAAKETADVWWGRNPALVGINNLLMVFAVYLYAVSGTKAALARKIRGRFFRFVSADIDKADGRVVCVGDDGQPVPFRHLHGFRLHA